MSERRHEPNVLNERFARAAGVASLLLAVAGIVMSLLYLFELPHGQPELLAMGIGKIVLLVGVAAVAVQLIRGRLWAQRLLLVLWLAALVGAVAYGLSALLWEGEIWWPVPWPLWAVLLPGAAIEALAVWLLVAASPAGSRSRYGSVVGLSIAAAVALVVAVNLFAQTEYLRADVESLRRYTLSGRTRQVAESIAQPVRFTVIYTGGEDPEQTERQRRRVLELLGEIREANRNNIEIESVTTDAGKARLVARLRETRQADAAQHVRALGQFSRVAGDMATELQTAQQQWRARTGESYLDQWGMAADVADRLGAAAQQLRQTASEIESRRAERGLPDYAELVSLAREALESTQNTLQQIRQELAAVAAIPPAVRENRDQVVEAADAAVAAAREMAATLGEPGSPAPQDISQAYERLSAASRTAMQRIEAAAQSLVDVAGPQAREFITYSRAFLTGQGGQGPAVVTPEGRVVSLGRETITDIYQQALETAAQARTYAEVLRPELQAEMVMQLRGQFATLVERVRQARDGTARAMEQLAAPDDATAGVLERAREGELYAHQTATIADLLQSLDQLPERDDDPLGPRLSENNIVLIETDDRVEVVGYDAIWPLKISTPGMEAPDQQRIFNGDSAIGSRLLTMTRPPFATVVLTYYLPEVPPQMARMVNAEIVPRNLTALRKHLEGANFEVREWNLAEGQKEPETQADRPEVLLILPPPDILPMPFQGGGVQPFGPEQIERITDAVDAGRPAVFLAMWQPPRQMGFLAPAASPTYPLASYLREQWGIDTRIESLVFSAVPLPEQPDEFRVDPMRLVYLPLNTFTAHPIVEPLQGRRTLWHRVCPILTSGSAPAGVSLQPLLVVPDAWHDTWATSRLKDLYTQFANEGRVRPDFEAGDIDPPFGVAMAASRAAGGPDPEPNEPAVAGNRIVVLGVAAGLVDGYLDARVERLNPDGTVELAPPPQANAEFISNSVYWLVGLERYIAAGPVQVEPVAMMSPSTRWLLWGLVATGLPALVLAVGGLVLVVRGRS